jgi:hypothetical protein
MHSPFCVRGEFARQKGPSSAAAVSVAPAFPLFSRQTRVENPIASAKRIPRCGCRGWLVRSC